MLVTRRIKLNVFYYNNIIPHAAYILFIDTFKINIMT